MDSFLNNRRILVTGGSGFLGTRLITALRGKGATVYNFSLDTGNCDYCIKGDITHPDEVSEAVRKANPDIVFHLAALISRQRDFDLFPEMLRVNVNGTWNLLHALRDTSCKRFIFTSSSEVYGNQPSPLQEDYLPMPVSPYSVTKVMAETLIRTYGRQIEMPYTILRVFNFFGVGMPETFFIPELINTLKRGEDFRMTGGEQLRDFLVVDDVIDAMILAAGSERSIGETLNICSGTGTSLAELAAWIGSMNQGESRILTGALPYREDEVWEMTGSPERAEEILGFRQKIPLKEGLKKMWYE